jgi:hypothetical protein
MHFVKLASIPGRQYGQNAGLEMYIALIQQFNQIKSHVACAIDTFHGIFFCE